MPTRYRMLAAALLLGGVAAPGLTACSKQKKPCYVVSGKEARELVTPGTILLDVRTREEYSLGHVAGSVHIPLEELSYRIGYLDVDTRIVVFSQKGKRAKEAAKLLRRGGYTVYELGAIGDWHSDESKCD